MYVKLLTFKLVKTLLWLPITSHFLAMIYASIVGKEVVGNSILEEFIVFNAILIITLIIKEILNVRTMRRRPKKV